MKWVGMPNYSKDREVLRMMTPLPHTSAGTSAWRIQMSAQTPVHQFTDDKTGDR
jgi:hypothetical protein